MFLVERCRDQEVDDDEDYDVWGPEQQVERIGDDLQQHRPGLGRKRRHREVALLHTLHLAGHQSQQDHWRRNHWSVIFKAKFETV